MNKHLKVTAVSLGAVALSLVGFGEAFGYGGTNPVFFLPSFTAPAGGFTATLNSGAVQTGTNTVKLTLNGGPSAVRMAVSNNPDFAGSSQEAYSETKDWTLSEGAGLKTVYVKFYDKNGVESPVLTTTVVSTGTTGSVLGTKVAVVDEIITATKLGSRGTNVVQLQNELKALGFFPANVATTGYFGPITAAAVKKYQDSLATPAVLGVKVTGSNTAINDLVSATKFGTRTDKVFQLQTELKKAGFYPTGYAVTGFYGAVTKASVEKYLAAQR